MTQESHGQNSFLKPDSSDSTMKLQVKVTLSSDVRAERAVLASAVEDLNRSLGLELQVSLKISNVKAELQPFPDATNRQQPSQESRNPDCDILIGIFWMRLGSKQRNAGLAIERQLQIAYRGWREKKRPKVLLFFKQEPSVPISRQDADQWIAMMKFRQIFPLGDVWWPFADLSQFRGLAREQLGQYMMSITASSGDAAHRKASEDYIVNDEDNLTVRVRALTSQTIPSLVAASKSPHDDVRRVAIDALAMAKAETAVPGLSALLSDQESSIRLKAIDVLSETPGESAVAVLAQALKSPFSDVRWRAVRSLGRVGGKKAVVALRNVFRQRDSDLVRPAAEALGRIGGQHAIATLVKGLANPDEDVRLCAVEGLARMRGEQIITALLSATHDENTRVRSRAIEDLSRMSKDPTVKGLELLHGEKALVALGHALKNEYRDIRQAAAMAIGEARTEKVLPELVKALNDESPSVRAQIVAALKNIGGARAIAALVESLRDESVEVRLQAAKALGRLEDWHPRVTSHTKSLKAPGPLQPMTLMAVEALVVAMTDESGNVRRFAVDALANIASPEAESALIEALKANHVDVRFRAVEALGKIGTEAAIRAVVAAYQDIGREKVLEESRFYVVHEFRHALTPLNAYVKMLDEGLRQTETDKERLLSLIVRIRLQTDATFELLDRYMDYSRLLKPRLAPTDISELLQKTLEEFKVEFEARRIAVHAQLADGIVTEVDSEMLTDVFRNVIVNAIQAIDSGGSLTFQTELDSGKTKIAISDSGSGIKRKDLPHLFEVGFTTKRNVRGAGIGLALSKRIIEEAHNGSIVIGNNTNALGAFVLIILPRKHPEIENGTPGSKSAHR